MARDVLTEALKRIADGQQCEKVVKTASPSGWCRNRPDQSIDAPYSADRWCNACIARDALDRLSAAPIDDRERLAELEDWLLGAEHHAGCSGEYKAHDGSWAYRCKCGLRELRDERPVSPSVDPEEG